MNNIIILEAMIQLASPYSSFFFCFVFFCCADLTWASSQYSLGGGSGLAYRVEALGAGVGILSPAVQAR